MATTGSFFFFLFFLSFFFSPWQNNLRPSAGLPMCSLALDFQSEEEKMDGRNEWEVREGCHGNTAFIIPSKFTPQLLGRSSHRLCVWLIDASPLSPRLLFCVVLESVTYPLGAEILRANCKSGCEQSERPAAADTSPDSFSHNRFLALLIKSWEVFRALFELVRPTPFLWAMSALDRRAAAAIASFPLILQFFHSLLRSKHKKGNTVGWTFALFRHVVWPYVAVQCTIVSARRAGNTNLICLFWTQPRKELRTRSWIKFSATLRL